MKKIMVFLLCFCMSLFLFVPASAEENTGRYIVKVDPAKPMLLSETEELHYLGNGLYVADSLDAAMSFSDYALYMFPDHEMELFDYPETTSDPSFSNQWYMDMLKTSASRNHGINGEGVTVAVVDSGVDSDHPDLAHVNILPGYNVIDGAADTTDTEDLYGHGTSVTGIIAAGIDNETATCGIADGVSILPIKITNSSGLSYSAFYAGLQKAVESDCDVINMSFGGALSAYAMAEINVVMKQAEEKGMIVVAAVGNSGSTSVLYPAGAETVVGVGALNSDGTLWSKSQRNSSVFVTVPGNNVEVLNKTGGVKIGSGTSYASPMVAAVAALVKQIKPDCTPEEFRALLQKTAVDAGEEGYDTSYGHGTVNIENIISELEESLPPLVIKQGKLNGAPQIYLHNNTEKTVIGTGYFATYEGTRLSSVLSEPLQAGKGTTTLKPQNADFVLLWDEALRPMTEKITLK